MTDTLTGPSLTKQPVKTAGLIAAALTAIGTLLVEGELELTLFMATAVICSLACFDAALDRRVDAFWPWMLVSVAVLSKTLPTVVSRLSDHIGPDAERFDHLGAVLAALCIAALSFLLARPPAGAEQRTPIILIVALSGIAGAVAGASVAFAGASGLGSERAARVFETLGWGAAAAILAGVAIAVGGTRRPPLPLLALAAGALGVAVLSARTASGALVDLGWWALAYFVMAVGSLGFSHATLGQRSGRRSTLTPAVVAVLAAVFSVQAMIFALGDRGTWGPGIVILPLLAIGLLALGLRLYRWGGAGDTHADDESATVFEMIADSTLDGDGTLDALHAPRPAPAQPAGAEAVAAEQAVVEPVSSEPAPAPPVTAQATEAEAPPAAAASAFSGLVGPSTPPVPSETNSAPVADAHPAPTPSAPVQPPPPAQPDPAQPEQVQPAAAQPAAAQPAAAQSAAAAETAPTATTNSTAGLAPHLVDPTTGLRSVAGLQAVLVEAFSRPRQATEVSIVMVALRNLGAVEEAHGRVAAARVTSELAERFSSRLPDAATARFASDAFAAVIDGPALGAKALIPRCADVLSELLEPIVVGDAAIEIDVAASMAQCYANEDIAGFIGRANTGLERAVAAAEPSLVAMP